MLEAEHAVVFDRAALLLLRLDDEVTLHQRIKGADDGIGIEVESQFEQGREPEGAANDGGMLQHPLLHLAEQVDTCRQHPLNGIRDKRQRQHVVTLNRRMFRRGRERRQFAEQRLFLHAHVPGAVFVNQYTLIDEHAHNLFDKKGVALGTAQNGVIERLRQFTGMEQFGNQFAALLAREGFQRDGGEVASSATPVAMALKKFQARGAEEEDGNVAETVRQVFQQVEQGFVGPLQIVDDDDERLLPRQRLKQNTPGAQDGTLHAALLRVFALYAALPVPLQPFGHPQIAGSRHRLAAQTPADAARNGAGDLQSILAPLRLCQRLAHKSDEAVA